MSRPGDWLRDTRPPVRSSPSRRPSPVPSSSSARDDAAADGSNKSQADAAVKRQRIAPNPALSKMQSAPPANASLDSDTKRVTELVCERVFWYMRRDDADKRFKKLQSDPERCNTAHSDFGSAYEILKLAKDAAEEEGKVLLAGRGCRREVVFSHAIGLGEVAYASIQGHRSCQAHPRHGILEQGCARTISGILPEIAPWGILIGTARLQAQLDKERKRNKLLEKRVDELGRKMIVLDEAKQRADRQETARRSELQKAQEFADFGAKIEEATKDLVSRTELDNALRGFDDNVSSLTIGAGDEQQQSHSLKPGDRTASKLQSLLKGNGIAAVEPANPGRRRPTFSARRGVAMRCRCS